MHIYRSSGGVEFVYSFTHAISRHIAISNWKTYEKVRYCDNIDNSPPGIDMEISISRQLYVFQISQPRPRAS